MAPVDQEVFDGQSFVRQDLKFLGECEKNSPVFYGRDNFVRVMQRT
jgi:hypothetical protein